MRNPLYYLEVETKWFLPAERIFFRSWYSIRHPRQAWFDIKRRLQRPKIGEWVVDCRYEYHQVKGYLDSGWYRDTLLFEDGHSASWINCCELPEEYEKWKNETS